MIEFCLIVGDTFRKTPNIDFSTIFGNRPDREIQFRVSGAVELHVSAFWSESHPVHNFSDRIQINDQGFVLLAGYALDENFKPIKSVENFDALNADSYSGDFFHLSVSTLGQVAVTKSTMCSYQIYSSKSGTREVLASRASLASAAAGNTDRPSANLDFARWICTYGGGGNTAALYEDTKFVTANQSVSVDDNHLVISQPNYRYLIDEDLQDQYKRSPTQYWDDVFEFLVQSTAVLDYSDKEIDFPLSGGKDSRLLLGLLCAGGHRDRLRRVFTNGPSVSPEVRSAQMVCDVLGLNHEFVDQTNMDRPQGFEVDDKLLRHIHVTDGEMSLSDLTWNPKKSNMMQLHGQELGLRNFYGNRDFSTREKLLDWFDIHLSNGDKLKLFKEGMAERNMDEVRDFVDASIASGIALSDIPTLHRNLLRSGRWVTRTWRAYNDRFFAPYIFLDTRLTKSTFNCGDAARAREEFHFEMMRRIAGDLIEIPFFGQTWDVSLAREHGLNLPEPLKWPEGTRTQTTKNTHLALFNVFDEVKKFLSDHQGEVTNELLNRDSLRDFEIEGAHPSFFLAFWNFVQIAILEKTPDFQTLATDTPVTELGLPSFNY